MNLQQVQMQPQGVVVLPGPQVYQGQTFSQHQPASGVVVVATLSSNSFSMRSQHVYLKNRGVNSFIPN